MTFSVPNESETGSPTTQLTVALPNVTSAHTELMPGWTVALQHDIAAGTFRSVTWTAAANAGIPADQFALFRIEVTLPHNPLPTAKPFTGTSRRCLTAANPSIPRRC